MIKALESNVFEETSAFDLLKIVENSGDAILYFRSCEGMGFETLNNVKELGFFREGWYNVGKELSNSDFSNGGYNEKYRK